MVTVGLYVAVLLPANPVLLRMGISPAAATPVVVVTGAGPGLTKVTAPLNAVTVGPRIVSAAEAAPVTKFDDVTATEYVPSTLPRVSVTTVLPSCPEIVVAVVLEVTEPRFLVAGTLMRSVPPVSVKVTAVSAPHEMAGDVTVQLVAAFAVAGTNAARLAVVRAVMPRAMVLRIVPPVTGSPS